MFSGDTEVEDWLKMVYANSSIDTTYSLPQILRDSRPEVFCKKGVLRNFAKFTGKRVSFF